jgi:hypothetical protein
MSAPIWTQTKHGGHGTGWGRQSTQRMSGEVSATVAGENPATTASAAKPSAGIVRRSRKRVVTTAP